jgi:tRNA-2-methylthio-N6-dimethylallyladenosine synthase
VKTERLDRLQKLLLAQQDQANQDAVGKVLPVLFEKPGRGGNQIVGRTPHLQPVHAEGALDLIGTIQDVRIDRRTANSLKGVLRESLPA